MSPEGYRGLMLNRGRMGWEAYDTEDRSVGVFLTQASAATVLLATVIE